MNNDQRQRWIKYGGNVLLSSIVVIALAVLVIYAAERKPKRIDTTAEGLYSLKPQTLKILKDVKTPIRIVSLYTQSKPPPSPDQDQSQQPLVPQDQAAQTVNDLLEEYANANKNITLETIDPVTSPAKADDLIEQVEAKYGGEIDKYKKFIDSFGGTIKQLNDIAQPQAKAVEDLIPKLGEVNADLGNSLREAIVTVEQVPKSLSDLQDALQPLLKQKPPAYKEAADAVSNSMGQVSSLTGDVIARFNELEKAGGLPPAVDAYVKASLPPFQAMKKIVDDCVASGAKLGELKLDTLRSALRERNSILLMGDKEWRSITFDQVWQPPAKTALAALSDAPPKPRFAGEQQVTAAILALSSGGTKPKVVFVRAGGAPLTQSAGFMAAEPPLAEVAARLGLYNYDVLEKDLTGQYAAQSQGMAPPEPSDDEIKNATWIVWAMKQPQSQFGGEAPSIAPQVAQHLKDGGSAVIVTGFQQDPMTEALSDWGVDVNTNQLIVHEKIPSAGGDSSDMLNDALRFPHIFDLHEYGDHPLAKPLESLEGLFVLMSPVKIRAVAGYHATPLLPIPTTPSAPHSWASSTFVPTDQNSMNVTFDPATDTDGPVNAGAAVEKSGGGRVVVLGCGVQFASNQLVNLTAQDVRADAPPVLLCPANGELFTDSVFWASRQDTLIDISPAAMDVGRIGDMSNAMLRFWRIGIMLIGLPGLVLLTGVGVYLERRD